MENTCVFPKKWSEIELDFILNVESALEVGVFSLYINVNYEIKLWRGPQAAHNTLGPSNIFFWHILGCIITLPKGFGPFFLVWNTFGMAQKGIWGPPGASHGFLQIRTPQGPPQKKT